MKTVYIYFVCVCVFLICYRPMCVCGSTVIVCSIGYCLFLFVLDFTK